MLLHLDAGDEQLPVPGDPVLRDGRAVGRVGTVVQHHELGPVALALVKRSVPVDAELVGGRRGAGLPGPDRPRLGAGGGRRPAARTRGPGRPARLSSPDPSERPSLLVRLNS